ncbi:MAG: hypothetical protein D6791_04750, partial [Chloroflexi bacterium]
NVVLFHWLTGTPILQSVIVVGQILNALAPLTIYPLVRRLGGSEWVRLIAGRIPPLLSPMPAGYVNWGRYTQLTGMTVLPVAATLTIDAVSSRDRSWRRLILASIAVAGLVLSHYLVTLLFVPLILAYLLWWSGRSQVFSRDRYLPSSNQQTPGDPRARQGKTWLLLSRVVSPWLRAGAVGLMAGLLIAPWILNLWSGYLPRVLAGRFGHGGQTAYFQTAYNAVGDLFAYVPPWLIALAAAGAVWGCWQRRPLAIVTSVWTALLVLVANPNLIGLPGAGVVNNFMLQIALYLPLSMVAGTGLAQVIEGVNTRIPYGQLITTVLVVVVALAGARLRLTDLDYRYRLVAPADMPAMEWIRDHTPTDARFLVNTFATFGGHLIVGEDAGWWIPYLAGRRNTVPPATYGMEAANDPDYPNQVHSFYRQIKAHPLDSAEAVEVLRANGITHVYAGAVGGQLVDPAALRDSPFYRLVYDQDGVMIFEVAK